MKYPFIQQEDYNDCGLACISMLYSFYFKKKLMINEIKENITLTQLGINVLELKSLSKKYNLLLECYKISFNELKQLTINKPLIIQVYNPNVGFHFIIIYKKKNDKWLIANPENIEIGWKNINEFSKIFFNVVLSTNIATKIHNIKKKWCKN